MIEADVAVLGGGPAGCAATIRARQAGLSTVLLERSAKPRLRPGETLHPGAEVIFAQLKVLDRICAAGFHRHRGVWVEWEGGRIFQAYGEDAHGPWEGFQAERSRLDEILLSAARDAGAIILHSCRAENLLLNANGKIVGLETTTELIQAQWVIDASGRASWLANKLGLPVQTFGPSLRVRFGWTADDAVDPDGQPTFQAHPAGWDWTAPLGGERSAWVKLRLPSVESARPLAHERSEVPQGSDMRHGMEFQWRFLPACAGPGYFVLGDAAATLDPSSSHGVLRALMSGILAGDLVARVESAGLDPVHATHAYRQWMHAQFTRDTVALRSLWKRHPSEAVRQEMASSF